MNRSATQLAAVVFLACFCNAAAGAWLTGYKHRQAITIDSSLTASDLTDYPLLVNLTDSGNPLFARSPSGTDIVFTAADGMTVLPREIETYTNNGTKELNAWVKTDISSTLPTTLYMYYKGPASSDSTAVWDSNYTLVQHLQEDPSGAGPQMLDSTSFGNDGTTTGGMLSTQQVAGRIGGSLDFSGSNQNVNLGNHSSLFPADVTLEAWAKGDTLATWNGVFTNKDGVEYGLNLQMGPQENIASLVGNGSGGAYIETAFTPNTDQWYHMAITHDSGTNLNTLYVDGIQVATLNRALAYSASTDDALIAAFYMSGALDFDGIIDEVRLSDSVRSADWILTQSLLVNNPTTYLSFGQEQPPIPEPGSLLLLGLGAAGLMSVIRRRRVRQGFLVHSGTCLAVVLLGSLAGGATADAATVFYVANGTSDTLDDPFQAAAFGTLETENFEGFTNGASVPSFSTSSFTVNLTTFDTSGVAQGVVPSVFQSGAFTDPLTVGSRALLNGDNSGNTAQVEFDFASGPVGAFGLWIWDDSGNQHKFRFTATEVGGATSTSGFMGAGTNGLDGFLGVISDVGLTSVIVESHDPPSTGSTFGANFFEMDNVQIGPLEPLPIPEPSTLGLLIAGVAVFAGRRHRRRT